MSSGTDWDELAGWWLRELQEDPTYTTEILPLALELLGDDEGVVVDLGCGDGRLLRALDSAVGCDVSPRLLERARMAAPVVRCSLPDLRWLRAGAVAGVVSVLVLEHIRDLATLIAHVGRVLEPGGRFVVVMNHPAYTPPGAGPVVDLSDGEVLWRWGPYFAAGAGTEPAGTGAVVFHHRPLGSLLNTIAGSGLALERFEERALGAEAVARDPGLAGQEHFPRLLGARWRKISAAGPDSHPAGP